MILFFGHLHFPLVTVCISQVLGSIRKAQISQQLNQPMSQLILGNLGDPFFCRLEENHLKVYEAAVIFHYRLKLMREGAAQVLVSQS